MTSVRDIAEPLIKKHERCVLHPYLDAANKWTIGWGCRFLANGEPVTQATPAMTQAEADALFDVVIEGLISQIERAVTSPLAGTNALAALTSFAYNVGFYAFSGSTLLKLLNAGHKQLAAGQFGLWVNADGKPNAELIRRRAEEKELFLTEDGDAAEGRIV